MELKSFLQSFRIRVKAHRGKHLSRREVVEKIFENSSENKEKIESRYEKWETEGRMPEAESDRKALMDFFGTNNLENISELLLQPAVNRWPNPAPARSASETGEKHSKPNDYAGSDTKKEGKGVVNSSGTKTILIDMDYLDFMKNTIEWQRGLMEKMVSKIPDAERPDYPKVQTG